jgi:hypothetical protein
MFFADLTQDLLLHSKLIIKLSNIEVIYTMAVLNEIDLKI